MKTILTHTGKIYVDTEHKLEFLTVGDYGKENNIKANFLGLTKEINGVANTELVRSGLQLFPLRKAVLCIVNSVMFRNLDSMETFLLKRWQIRNIIKNETVRNTDRFNVHFARMGEPTWNDNVLAFGIVLKEVVKSCGLIAKTVHPVVSTMLPRANRKLHTNLVWNDFYGGEAGLQFSINSTNDEQRRELFDNKSHSLATISEMASRLPMPKGRKYTLNFPVTAQTILDAKELSRLFDKEKFIVKITPIHETASAVENGFEVTGYSDYNVYRQFEQPLLEEGWDVIVFVPSKEEDADRITCGNALISEEKI